MNPNQFMHQNQILDGLGRSSNTIRSQWMVLEDLLTPSKPASNLILDGIGRSSNTVHSLCMVSEEILRMSKI